MSAMGLEVGQYKLGSMDVKVFQPRSVGGADGLVKGIKKAVIQGTVAQCVFEGTVAQCVIEGTVAQCDPRYCSSVIQGTVAV
jgi:hypothetical protein